MTGGCQCGAVRYALAAAPVRAEFCHCRMCQRAVGGVFAAFADVRREDFRWLTGEPALYASSPPVQRGFCAACGTPLSYEAEGEATLAVTMGSLDEPDRVPVTGHCGVQSKIGWLRLNDGLPQRRTGEAFAARDQE